MHGEVVELLRVDLAHRLRVAQLGEVVQRSGGSLPGVVPPLEGEHQNGLAEDWLDVHAKRSHAASLARRDRTSQANGTEKRGRGTPDRRFVRGRRLEREQRFYPDRLVF